MCEYNKFNRELDYYTNFSSKSPAMLDKHINRHVADCTKNGHRYDCPLCQFSTTDQRLMFEHLRDHQIPKESNEECENACKLCTYK